MYNEQEQEELGLSVQERLCFSSSYSLDVLVVLFLCLLPVLLYELLFFYIPLSHEL